MIQKLQRNVIQEIGAQQVMASIVDCVKQLIDNSLDAKANQIQIMLSQYGKQKIQVRDNGFGIQQENLCRLGTKGNTSKNSDKLQALTLGFRGQAVSCIARVSREMIIQSNTSQNSKGYVYDVKSQKILSSTNYIPKGTKVIIQGIFKYLPVRQNQLKQKQKHFLSQIFQLVKQYSLVYYDVSFLLSNEKQRNKQTIFECIKHQGVKQKCWKQRIGEILGKRIREKIIYIEGSLIQGFVLNKIESGSSHQNDCIKHNILQLYIHKRPLDGIASLKSTIESIYKKYNKSTKYIGVLNIKLDMSYFDINVTSNKRQIMINKKADQALNQLFCNLIEKHVIEVVPNINQKQSNKEQQRKSLKNITQYQDKIFSKRQSIKNFGKQQNIENAKQQQKPSNKLVKQLNHKIENRSELSQNAQRRSFLHRKQPIKMQQERLSKIQIHIKSDYIQNQKSKTLDLCVNKLQANNNRQKAGSLNEENLIYPHLKVTNFNISKANQLAQKEEKRMDIFVERQQRSGNQEQQIKQQYVNASQQNREEMQRLNQIQADTKLKDILKLDFNNERAMSLGQQFKRIMDYVIANVTRKDAEITYLRDVSEQQKQRSISKQNFKQFQLLGQFNRGFIPCLFQGSMFIIDQHSASEKDRFQTLLEQEPSFVQTRDCIQVNMIQLDKIQANSDQLREDGFIFQLQRQKNGSIVYFHRYPVAFGRVFDKQVFLELIQSGGSLKKFDAFQRAAATKACRSAIMIGDVLSDHAIKALVNKLSVLNSPWNCPHGRPTTLEIARIKSINQKLVLRQKLPNQTNKKNHWQL